MRKFPTQAARRYAYSMPSALKTRCPNCQNVARVTNSLLGKSVRCPDCQQPFKVSSIEVAHFASGSIDQLPLAIETVEAGSSDTAAETYAKKTFAPADPPPSPEKLGAPSQGKLGRFELKQLLGQGTFG